VIGGGVVGEGRGGRGRCDMFGASALIGEKAGSLKSELSHGQRSFFCGHCRHYLAACMQ